MAPQQMVTGRVSEPSCFEAAPAPGFFFMDKFCLLNIVMFTVYAYILSVEYYNVYSVWICSLCRILSCLQCMDMFPM